MIDARIAQNLLLVLRPEIERAQALLEAVQALQAVVQAGIQLAADVQGKTAGQFLSEQETQPVHG